MQQDHHLRPVPTADSEPVAAGATVENPASRDDGQKEQKRQARPRAAKALPTDRLKLDAQKSALRAIAVASDYGKNAVGSNDIAPRMGVAPSTAGLNNAFFKESGLITRESKGKYLPTDAANSFARTYSFDKQRAGASLKEPLSSTWYFETVSQQIAGMGPSAKDALIELLAHRAEASKEHELQLGSLLTWLEYAGLIVLDGSLYKLAPNLPSDKAADKADKPAAGEKEKPSPAPERATMEEKPTGNEVQPQPVLSFSFDIALTQDDLKELSAEQIKAVFEAVGKVMAIKK